LTSIIIYAKIIKAKAVNDLTSKGRTFMQEDNTTNPTPQEPGVPPATPDPIGVPQPVEPAAPETPPQAPEQSVADPAVAVDPTEPTLVNPTEPATFAPEAPTPESTAPGTEGQPPQQDDQAGAPQA